MVNVTKYHGAQRPLFSQGHMLIEFKTGFMPFASVPFSVPDNLGSAARDFEEIVDQNAAAASAVRHTTHEATGACGILSERRDLR